MNRRNFLSVMAMAAMLRGSSIHSMYEVGQNAGFGLAGLRPEGGSIRYDVSANNLTNGDIETWLITNTEK